MKGEHTWWVRRSDGCESLDCVRITLDQINQQRRLSIRLGAALFPVFQGADVGSQIDGKKRTRDLQVFAYADQFLRCDFGAGLYSTA